MVADIERPLQSAPDNSTGAEGRRKVLLAVTGASAAPVSRKMLAMLAALPHIDLGCMVSPGAEQVWEKEGQGGLGDFRKLSASYWDAEDFGAGPASGSWWRPSSRAAMIILPCSMSTLGALAAGFAANAIHRAGAVALKEGVPLILVPRETPLSVIALRNMSVLAAAGATVMPFCPGFYFHPQNLDDLCEQFCCRVLEQIEVRFPCPRWDSVV